MYLLYNTAKYEKKQELIRGIFVYILIYRAIEQKKDCPIYVEQSSQLLFIDSIPPASYWHFEHQYYE